jgi:hypothetical protein
LVQQGIGIEFMLRLSCHRCRRWRSLGTPNLPGVFNGPVYDAELMNGLVEDVKVGSSPSTVPCLILCGSLIQQRRMLYRLELRQMLVHRRSKSCMAGFIPIHRQFSKHVETCPGSPDTCRGTL